MLWQSASAPSSTTSSSRWPSHASSAQYRSIPSISGLYPQTSRLKISANRLRISTRRMRTTRYQKSPKSSCRSIAATTISGPEHIRNSTNILPLWWIIIIINRCEIRLVIKTIRMVITRQLYGPQSNNWIRTSYLVPAPQASPLGLRHWAIILCHSGHYQEHRHLLLQWRVVRHSPMGGRILESGRRAGCGWRSLLYSHTPMQRCSTNNS